MSVEVRIKAEMEKNNFVPKESGDQTVEIDIPNEGITLDEVIGHRWVEDAYVPPEDDIKFQLYIAAEKQKSVYTI